MAYETQRVSLRAAPYFGEERRARLFRESLPAMAERWAPGLAWTLMPSRIVGVPNVLRLSVREFLAPDYALPDPEHTFAQPPRLAGD